MKFSGLARIALCVAALLMSATAFAAKKPSKKGDEFPNATRTSPKIVMSEREKRELTKAGDLIDDDKGMEALPIIDKVLGNEKASKYVQAYALQLKSRAYWDADDDERGLAELIKAIDLDAMPNESQFGLLYRAAQMSVQLEKYSEALGMLERWEKESGQNTPDSLALKGNLFYRTERYQDAIDTMKQAIARSDEPHESWTQILMASYFELEQYDEAAALLQAQLARNPNDFKLMKNLAMVYVNADKYPQAIEVLSKARAQNLITSQDDYLQLAKLYANADKTKEAAETMQEGFAKNVIKPSAQAYHLLGDFCAQSDQDECAIEAYTKASPLATDGNVDYQLGYFLYYSDRSAEARQALDRAISKGGLRQEGEAYVMRGDIRSDLNDNAGALADWRKAATFPSSKAMADQRIKAATAGVKLKRSAPKK